MHKTTLLKLAPLALILAVGTLGGCAGHGKYTQDHISGAKRKMDAMKAATEWQTARAAYLSGDMEKALKHVDISISMNNEVVKSQLLRGRIMLEMGNIEQSVVSFRRAEELDPKSAEPKYYLGVVNERIAHHEKAMEYYLQASNLEPTNPQYAVAAAEVMIDLGKLDEAKSFLAGQQQTFEHNPGVRQTLGHIAMMQDEPIAAVSHFNEARLLAADDPSILEDLARAQVASGQFAEAEFSLSQLLAGDANKERRDLQLLRAQVLTKIDRLIESRGILLTLTRDSAGAADVEAWITLGNVCFLLNDPTRVRQAAARVIGLAPDRPEGYTLRGLMARQSNELQVALSNFRQALQLKQTAETWILVGLTQLDLDDENGARKSLERALSLDPESVAAKELLAQIDSN